MGSVSEGGLGYLESRGSSGSRGSGFRGHDGRFGQYGDSASAGRGRGSVPQGRDGGAPVLWRHNDLPYVEKGSVTNASNSSEKAKDTLLRENEMLDAGAKRRLMIELGNPNEGYDEDGKAALADMVIENDEHNGEVDEVSGEIERNKRLKKVGATSPSAGSAGFHEGPVREQ